MLYRYTDWTGEKKQTQKRGFQTRREALAWEREQLDKKTADLDIVLCADLIIGWVNDLFGGAGAGGGAAGG